MEGHGAIRNRPHLTVAITLTVLIEGPYVLNDAAVHATANDREPGNIANQVGVLICSAADDDADGVGSDDTPYCNGADFRVTDLVHLKNTLFGGVNCCPSAVDGRLVWRVVAACAHGVVFVVARRGAVRGSGDRGMGTLRCPRGLRFRTKFARVAVGAGSAVARFRYVGGGRC